MLLHLFIQNFALIEKITFEPSSGLNVITGETGSGKSMLINGILLLLGERGGVELIRKGQSKLVVEAEFSTNELIENFLIDNNYDIHKTLLIRREISNQGKSRGFINDSPAKISQMKDLGSLLIDFHGQHDHQTLLHNRFHRKIIDNFGKIDLNSYKLAFDRYKKLKAELESIIQNVESSRDKIELLSYHMKEIDKVSPKDGEDRDLEEELSKMENIENIRNLADKIDFIVNERENSVLNSLKELDKLCDSISVFDSSFEDYKKDLESSYSSIKDFANSTENYAASLFFDEERYKEISNRFQSIDKLKKKFKMDLGEVIEYRCKIDEELGSNSDFELFLDKKKSELKKVKNELQVLGEEISRVRKRCAKEFEKKVKEQFSDVGLSSAELSVNFLKLDDFGKHGLEDIEFFVRTNKGEDFKPLSKTASGGEISRIMLSIKSISRDNFISSMIFDEIDTGISGKTADMVGEKMLQLSKIGQLILITHLPIIAKRADSHFKIFKTEDNETTFTGLKRLNDSERETEIISMVGGSLIIEN